VAASESEGNKNMTASDKTQAPKQRSCALRWKANKNDRIRDLCKLFRAYQQGDEEKYANELGTFNEYGLSFDYVAPETFRDQAQGYWRYQLSWGGPSDEFRFYAGGCGDQEPHRISYVFLDWFDGRERSLVGLDLKLMREIWGFFSDTGLTKAEYRKGTDTTER
jgi:hypothetical protein